MQYVKNRPFPQIELAHNVWIQCKSADNPKGLLGEGLDLLILDEAANISRTVWFDQLMPTMADRKGIAVFISTPKGKNWFYDLYMRAKELDGAFHFTSEDNPYFPQDEWERFKRESPPDFFQQNHEATFLEKAASVFRNIRDIIDPNCLSEPTHHRYIMGVDLAQVKDFTVAVLLDLSNHHLVAYDRFQKITYPLQIQRLYHLAMKYNRANIVLELNNVGLAVADELKSMGAKVSGFKTVGTISKDLEKKGSKQRAIEKLAVDIENRNLTIPDWETLIEELEIFGQEMTPAGNIRYAAPEGYHDDCVIALALANWGLHGKAKTQNIRAKKSMSRKRKQFEYF
jgi:hypothetical protein